MPRSATRWGGKPGDVGAVVAEAALRGRGEAGDEVEQRGLARPVGADEPEQLARRHREGDRVDGEDAAESARDAVDPQERARQATAGPAGLIGRPAARGGGGGGVRA